MQGRLTCSVVLVEAAMHIGAALIACSAEVKANALWAV